MPKLAQICIFVLEKNYTQTDINVPPNKATFIPSNIITEVPAIRHIRIKNGKSGNHTQESQHPGNGLTLPVHSAHNSHMLEKGELKHVISISHTAAGSDWGCEQRICLRPHLFGTRILTFYLN